MSRGPNLGDQLVGSCLAQAPTDRQGRETTGRKVLAQSLGGGRGIPDVAGTQGIGPDQHRNGPTVTGDGDLLTGVDPVE